MRLKFSHDNILEKVIDDIMSKLLLIASDEVFKSTDDQNISYYSKKPGHVNAPEVYKSLHDKITKEDLPKDTFVEGLEKNNPLLGANKEIFLEDAFSNNELNIRHENEGVASADEKTVAPKARRSSLRKILLEKTSQLHEFEAVKNALYDLKPSLKEAIENSISGLDKNQILMTGVKEEFLFYFLDKAANVIGEIIFPKELQDYEYVDLPGPSLEERKKSLKKFKVRFVRQGLDIINTNIKMLSSYG
jgi:hypothetical protein